MSRRDLSTNLQVLKDSAEQHTMDHYRAAIRFLDREFGVDYAKEHPRTVAMFARDCSFNFASALIASILEQAIEEGIIELSTAITWAGQGYREEK